MAGKQCMTVSSRLPPSAMVLARSKGSLALAFAPMTEAQLPWLVVLVMSHSDVMTMKGAEARVSLSFAAKLNGSSPIYKGLGSHTYAMRSRGQFYLQLKVGSILVRIRWRYLEEHGLGGRKPLRKLWFHAREKGPMANASGTRWSWERSGWHGWRDVQKWRCGQTWTGGGALRRGELAIAGPGLALHKEKLKLAG
jgi:hypothetical protein